MDRVRFGGGGSIGAYMQRRSAGVAQHLARLAPHDATLDIFRGCTFYLDGYIQPRSLVESVREPVGELVREPVGGDPAHDLGLLIIACGGRVDIAQSNNVTHYIIESVALGCTKWWRLRLKNEIKSGPFIVTPQYVYDSWDAKIRLDEAKYIPQSLRNPSIKVGLDTYFKKSRLHLLGRYKGQMAIKYNLKPLNPTNACTFIHLDMDQFFVSVALRHAPHLKSEPVAVSYGTGASSCSEIATCNYEARKYGVTKGMWVRTALHLCPQLKFVPYRLDEITSVAQAALETAIAIAGRQIYCQSCDEFTIQVECPSHSKLMELVKRLKDACASATGCPLSIGVASNVLVAKLACTLSKRVRYQSAPLLPGCSIDDNICHVHCAQQFMDAVPIDMVPAIPANIVKVLNENKIKTCGDLHAVPHLATLVGKRQSEVLLQISTGTFIDPRAIANAQKPR
ncbi:bifunctional Reverse transcriptase-Diguanylate cyclase domain/BRCT domain superfamily/BRCT domain/DNA-RNA polymerase superfamily/UmuC domain [Babesia duncani]|uniref:Bifunctional Reverse transcriptase-Diguanylate cyclase domain/BRCT domain superfamily/BRCT domain/DNA-RNA polymerase superfamily/UmuC domain n=1 Tax=Babesia duncani TaxID=323732 RepID=A0AAD9UQ71_9APIC|nr:bifunctional Reverse transcriptase-Diguanylate cyclase domain/BRCT domain superfamily/BRCT domain/DNA-RNA polymerase superfamily/UmuC domain [Babesia duncani]